MGISNQQWPWFALLVRASREKTASLLLENAGYECYLPTSKYMRRWSDRIKEIEVPLFPGYLFCRMNPHNRLPVLMTPGVIQIVGVGKNPDSRRGRGDRRHPARGKKRSFDNALAVPGNRPVVRIEEGPLQGLTESSSNQVRTEARALR